MDPAIEPDCGGRAGTAAGFTLIELLVCVAILAVLAVAASLALPRGSSPGSRDRALFQSQFEAARQLAVSGGQSRGLAITPQGLQMVQRGAGGWQDPGRLQRWQGSAVFARRGAAAAPGAPQIQFLANGRTSAFRLSFQDGSTCESDGWAGLSCTGGETGGRAGG